MDIIIGGGITGLSYAMFKENDEYNILEAQPQIGGYCKTTKRNGFVWDYSGHFFHFRNEEIEKLVLNGFSQKNLVDVVKNTKIFYKKTLIEYPFQKNIHQLPKNEFIECLYDLFNIEDSEYTTFKQMLYSKFGKGIAEKFLIPYNSKLYATDLNQLDKDAMGRFFPYAEKEEIVKNFKANDNQSYNTTFKYPRGGAVEYIKSIVGHIDNSKIRTEAEVVNVDVVKKEITLASGEAIKYDRLISTMPITRLYDLASVKYDKNLYSWNKVLVFNLGFNKKGPISEVHWMYFPEEEFPFYRVGFYDNIMGTNKTSLYVELGFSKDEKVMPNMFLGKVISGLKKAGLITNDMELIDFESIIMDPAYVHITSKSIQDVAAMKDMLSNFDIYSIGRYGSWTYCSIEDNIIEAKRLAERLNK